MKIAIMIECDNSLRFNKGSDGMRNKHVQELAPEKLLQYGCIQEKDTYRCIQRLKTADFYAVITFVLMCMIHSFRNCICRFM